MGTTSMHRPKGMSNKDFFTTELLMGDRQRVLKDFTKGGVWYAAVEDIETGKVFAAVVSFNWGRGYHNNFSYKVMDETMGPYSYDAPESLLSLLSPTTSEYALKWREKCQQAADRAAWRKKALKALDLQPGDLVSLPYYPILVEATVVDLKGNRFRGADGTVYRVPGWRDHISLEEVS